MTDDRKRKYESASSMPVLRAHIGVPPLKMVLLGELREDDQEDVDGAAAQPGLATGLNSRATKEQVVRRIIEHLKKDT